MVIQHNMSALNANLSFGTITGLQKKTTEKLSTGYQINRAADDAAGLTISEKMRYQIRGLNRGSNNVQDGISYCQVADGALAETQEMLHRMTELSVQASNDTLTPEDRQAIQEEISSLKLEMARVFDTTSFNDQEIWQKTPDSKVAIPGEYQYAVQPLNKSSQEVTVTDTNSDRLSKDRLYNVTASTADGVKVSWTGNDGNSYQVTESLADFRQNGVINFNDAVMVPSGTAAPINAKFSFATSEDATDDEVAQAMNGTTFYESDYLDVSLSLTTTANGINFSNMSINPKTAYQSHTETVDPTTGLNVGDEPFDYDSYDASTITPAAVDSSTGTINDNVANVTYDNPGWTMTFKMDGVGLLTAKSSNTMSYHSWGYNTSNSESYGTWWTRGSNGNTYYVNYSAPATIEGYGSVVTGSGSNPAIDANGNTYGGYTTLTFGVTDESGNSVGGFSMYMGIYNGESAESVQNRITEALSNTAVVTPGGLTDKTIGFNTAYPTKEIAQYDKVIGMNIQAGYKEGQSILLQYKSLSLASLGLTGASCLDYESAQSCLTASYSALDKISEQRSTFGAYINRMEHAMANDDNTSENTQSAESRIRDTDMAAAMVALSAQNIIAQAGQSMISSANRNPQHILDLLQ